MPVESGVVPRRLCGPTERQWPAGNGVCCEPVSHARSPGRPARSAGPHATRPGCRAAPRSRPPVSGRRPDELCAAATRCAVFVTVVKHRPSEGIQWSGGVED